MVANTRGSSALERFGGFSRRMVIFLQIMRVFLKLVSLAELRSSLNLDLVHLVDFDSYPPWSFDTGIGLNFWLSLTR